MAMILTAVCFEPVERLTRLVGNLIVRLVLTLPGDPDTARKDGPPGNDPSAANA